MAFKHKRSKRERKYRKRSAKLLTHQYGYEPPADPEDVLPIYMLNAMEAQNKLVQLALSETKMEKIRDYTQPPAHPTLKGLLNMAMGYWFGFSVGNFVGSGVAQALKDSPITSALSQVPVGMTLKATGLALSGVGTVLDMPFLAGVGSGLYGSGMVAQARKYPMLYDAIKKYLGDAYEFVQTTLQGAIGPYLYDIPPWNEGYYGMNMAGNLTTQDHMLILTP